MPCHQLQRLVVAAFAISLMPTLLCPAAHGQELNLQWKPRRDLNVLLPPSVRVYEANGTLPDSSSVRAMYATIDLLDGNLTLRAVGSNTYRETTLETYNRHDAILAINGGYFSSDKSVSLLVSDGKLLAPGPQNITRGAFGLVNGKPQITWPYAIDSTDRLFQFENPVSIGKALSALKSASPWTPSQAVGGGPVLIREGKIHDTSREEGFGGSHLTRHPRTAIGFLDDHMLLMMVVDGRQQSSAGVTIAELAQIMLEVGCQEAVNLDGGGSSAMVAAGEVVNVPVDIPNGNQHSLRRNASALVLGEETPSVDRTVLLMDTDSEYYEEHGIWKNSNHVNFYGSTPSREAASNRVNTAVYRFEEIERDSFQLAVWWTVSERNTDSAAFIVHHGKKIDSLLVDQTDFSSNGRWNVLGNYLLTEGDYIEIVGRGDGRITVDAIRLIDVGPLQELPPRGDLRVAVISDLNSGLGSASYEWQVDSIISRIPRCWAPDLVLCGGDMVAGMGVSDTATLNEMWGAFNEHLAEPLRKSKIPFAFTIGNHDGLRSLPKEREALVSYWTNPAHQTGLTFVDDQHFPHYYSFRIGDAFFVSWDASSAELTEENLRWVEAQFESAESKQAKFRFVVGHLPIYSVAQERDSKGNVLENGDSLRKLLEKFDVNVYISGHQHAYYPGRRGNLQLLNCGAAGSGPRRWLTTDLEPVNTITIMDVFYDRDTIAYHTYDIRHRSAKNMSLTDYHDLPSSIAGVNGFVIRNDKLPVQKADGVFFGVADDGESVFDRGSASAELRGSTILLSGTFALEGNLLGDKDAITVHHGRHAESGEVLFSVPVKRRNRRGGTFSGTFEMSDGMPEMVSAGACHLIIRSDKYPDGELRAQLYPRGNIPPERSAIISHNDRNTYGIRNIEGLYKIEWSRSSDRDGDNVTYIYQIGADSLFSEILFSEGTGRNSFVKMTERSLFDLLTRESGGDRATWYHRVIASDGLHVTLGHASAIHLMKSDEPIADLMEVEPDHYVLDGKIPDADGRGSGALWDKDGKLWLADYGGILHVKLSDNSNASFSPLREVSVGGRTFSLKPINGIGLDLDGNILVGSNRFLFKIDATTGKGIAAWEAPEGERAITTPRVNEKGEIHAMSLFAEDPNYVLKQSASRPDTFELQRTIRLPDRILSRTFDMSSDGLTLFFPDPGSPIIQTFTSDDGITYTRGDDIISTAAGCNAIKVIGKKLFAAVRPSGIAGTTLHMRDEHNKTMWTLDLAQLNGAEPRGIAVSDDGQTIVVCGWDKGGGFFVYALEPRMIPRAAPRAIPR